MIAICSNGHITGTKECPMCGSVRFEKIPARRVMLPPPPPEPEVIVIVRRPEDRPRWSDYSEQLYRDAFDAEMRRVERRRKGPPFKQWRKLHRDKPALMAVLRAVRRSA